MMWDLLAAAGTVITLTLLSEVLLPPLRPSLDFLIKSVDGFDINHTLFICMNENTAGTGHDWNCPNYIQRCLCDLCLGQTNCQDVLLQQRHQWQNFKSVSLWSWMNGAFMVARAKSVLCFFKPREVWMTFTIVHCSWAARTDQVVEWKYSISFLVSRNVNRNTARFY